MKLLPVIRLPFFGVLVLALILPVHATTVRPPSLDTLVAQSETVFRGTVIETKCEWRGEGSNRRIVTVVTYEIGASILGDVPSFVDLEFLGGEINGEGMIVAGQPQFKVGDEDILFVSKGKGIISPLVRMMYGRYLIAEDENGRPFVARTNGIPLFDPKETAVAMSAADPGLVLEKLESGEALSPDAFISAIKETANRLQTGPPPTQ